MRASRAVLPAGTAFAVPSVTFLSCGGGGGRQLVREGCIANPPPMIEDGFREPDVRVSEDGVLETTLKATYSAVNINGHEYTTLNYNDSFPGPTLVVCPGDRLIVHLVNDLGAAPGAWGPTPPCTTCRPGPPSSPISTLTACTSRRAATPTTCS